MQKNRYTGVSAFCCLLFLILMVQEVASQTNAPVHKSEANPTDSSYSIEFRARKQSEEGYMHAFIGIWRRQADGRSNLVQSAGFYPKGSNKADAIYGPGEVATIDKASPSDRVFVAQINEEQTRRVGWVVKNWKDKTYVLGIQDCVSMVMDVAVSIGLKVGTPFPEDVVLPTDIAIPLTEFPVITPDRLIDKLSELNKSETPLLHAASKSGDIHIKQRNDQARVAQRVKVAAERERRYPKARGSEATPTLPIGTWEIETFDARMTQEIK